MNLVKTASHRTMTDPRYIAKGSRYETHTKLSDSVVREKIQIAINEEKIAVFAQPIVSLPQRRTQFYELFARVNAKPGVYLPITDYAAQAAKGGMMSDLDHLLLIEALRAVQKSSYYKEDTVFFLNVTTETLKSSRFMEALLHFMKNNRSLASKLVFEVHQADLLAASSASLQVLEGLARLGCGLSVDHLDSVDFDPILIDALNIRFVKINALDLLQTLSLEKRNMLWAAKQRLEELGVAVIIEKIETEAALRDLLDHDVSYAQGYLFGRPDLLGSFSQRYAA